MTTDHALDALKSALDYPALRRYWVASTSLGFCAALIAEALDLLEPAPYAAYYAGAVNAAISPRFWDLLSVIGLLLLCLILPLLLINQRRRTWPSGLASLCQAGHFVFRTVFTLGALATGLLFAHMLLGRFDSPAFLAWGELFFNFHPVLALLVLLALNTGLGGIGQALAQPAHPFWQQWLTKPYPILWVGYWVFAGLVAVLVFSQQ